MKCSMIVNCPKFWIILVRFLRALNSKTTMFFYKNYIEKNINTKIKTIFDK